MIGILGSGVMTPLLTASISLLGSLGTQLVTNKDGLRMSTSPATGSCGSSKAAFAHFSYLVQEIATVKAETLVEGILKSDVIRQPGQLCRHEITGSFGAWNDNSRLVTVNYQVVLHFDLVSGSYEVVKYSKI